MADAIQWDKVMGKKVRSIDGEDIGKVENVNTDAIEVKDGLIAKRHYYIPKHSIQEFDGDDNLMTICISAVVYFTAINYLVLINPAKSPNPKPLLTGIPSV